ncbi:hypothetical protein PAHAL_6G112300 [Panicum hallii]|uniref:F-box domain-containing protein n=1 Tax=Panicum hallii TaxID=206008 RepID=A0A2T8IFY3_9POAL|nr:hypothetical protein PAHAL_6G112300 [Panicum hallii]
MEGGGGSWRAHLPWGSRQRVVRRIFEVLKRSFPADLTEGLIDLQRVAERLEWRIYSVARDQNEYLQRISLRVLYFSSESPLLLEPRPTQMALPSNELSHRREVDHSDTEEDLLDRDRPRSHKKLCEDDRLSDLPDSMLHHIMSFLSAKEAARTCVLSQRWRLLWTSAPCLDISIDQFGNDRVRFSKFVEHLLQSRAPASLDTFCLHTCALDRACNWIDHAIKHNVRVLEFTEDARWEPLYLDPQCLAFSSEFLTCLKVTNVALDGSVFDPLSRTCPSLETLQLIGSFFEVSEISSNSLKRLDIIGCFFSKDLMIRTPNLISLCLESPQCKCAWFNDPSKTTAAITL